MPHGAYILVGDSAREALRAVLSERWPGGRPCTEWLYSDMAYGHRFAPP